jgi:chemotaxis protein methyltransferase CheR
MNTETAFSALNDLLENIHRVYGYDFTHYAKSSLQRRVIKFIRDKQFLSLEGLQKQITNDKVLFDLFLEDITVNVTELFRDPKYYQFLREHIITGLAAYPIIKIWHAGCSTGEEVISTCILLHELGLLQRSKIYATDINPKNLEIARRGMIHWNSMKENAENYYNSGGIRDFSTYYTRVKDMAVFNQLLTKNVIFSQHNLVSDHVFNEFQWISCRNVMIYFDRILQDRVLKLFQESLAPFGILSIGLKETLTFSSVNRQFDCINKDFKIYRRK